MPGIIRRKFLARGDWTVAHRRQLPNRLRSARSTVWQPDPMPAANGAPTAAATG